MEMKYLQKETDSSEMQFLDIQRLLAEWLCVYIYNYAMPEYEHKHVSKHPNHSNSHCTNQMVWGKVYHFLLIVQNIPFSGNSFKAAPMLSWLKISENLWLQTMGPLALWPRESCWLFDWNLRNYWYNVDGSNQKSGVQLTSWGNGSLSHYVQGFISI